MPWIPLQYNPSPSPTTSRDRSVLENTPPGVNIGDPISATDPDEGILEYGDTPDLQPPGKR